SPGMRTHNVVQIDLQDRGRVPAVALVRRVREVRQMASATFPPLDGIYPTFDVGPQPSLPAPVKVNVVSSDYFSILDLPPIRGRAFSSDEAQSGEKARPRIGGR